MTSPLARHIRALSASHVCAPHASGSARHGCFDERALRRVAEVYNRRHPDDPVHGADVGQLHAELSRRLFASCRDDPLCWLEQLRLADDQALRGSFKARAGSGWDMDVDTWLTDEDIENAMAMYTGGDGGFRFLGVFTIDFDQRARDGRCIGDFMCALDVGALVSSGVTKLAAVFNTDDSSGSGEHWIAMYACAEPDNPNYGVMFYDSMGTPGGLQEIPPSIRRIMRHTAAGIARPGAPRPALRWCPRAQQREDGQCGMFCIVFLAAMLHDEPFEDFCADRSLTDRAMQGLRSVFFTPRRGGGPVGSGRAGGRSARRSPARSRLCPRDARSRPERAGSGSCRRPPGPERSPSRSPCPPGRSGCPIRRRPASRSSRTGSSGPGAGSAR